MGWGGACSRSCEVHTVSMLRCIHVKHSLGEFTKRVAERLRRNRLGGTQVLDRIWDSLKRTLPRTLSTRQLCPWMPCACACSAMYGCGTGDTGSRVKDPMF